jgi:lysozyme
MNKQRITLAAALGSVTIATGALTYVGKWEGKANVPYRDIVGVLTVCHGETKGVERRRYSDAECGDMLSSSMLDHWDGIAKCSVIESRPPRERVAHLSLAYNIGVGAWCRSSIPARLERNDGTACAVISQFNKARVAGVLVEVRGLTNRRESERAICDGRTSI